MIKHFVHEDPQPSIEEHARVEACEALSRVFLWIADGRTVDECGFRSMVALSTINPSIFDGATLEEIGCRTGRQKQAVWKLQEEFRKTFGL
jgi:hypothetical protein